MNTTPNDPMEFLKSLWGTAGMPLPGLVTPTLDTNELDKRVADLKAVEGWLKTNLGMLQMTIQGLEMQRATLTAMQAFSQSAQSAQSAQPAAACDANSNPFANPALWPWNFPRSTTSATNPETQTDSATETSQPGSAAEKSTARTKGRGKPHVPD